MVQTIPAGRWRRGCQEYAKKVFAFEADYAIEFGLKLEDRTIEQCRTYRSQNWIASDLRVDLGCYYTWNKRENNYIS